MNSKKKKKLQVPMDDIQKLAAETSRKPQPPSRGHMPDPDWLKRFTNGEME